MEDGLKGCLQLSGKKKRKTFHWLKFFLFRATFFSEEICQINFVQRLTSIFADMETDQISIQTSA